MLGKLQDLRALSQSDGWTTLVTDKKKDILIKSKRTPSRGTLTLFSQGSVDYPALDIWRCIA